MNSIGTAKLIADVMKQQARFCTKKNTWFYYDFCAWKTDEGALRVMELLKGFLQQWMHECFTIRNEQKQTQYMNYIAKNITRKARESLLKDAAGVYPLTPEDFDKDVYLFNCKNITYNLKTFVAQPHNPEDFITKTANVVYDEMANCPLWNKTFSEIMNGDAEKRLFVQKAIGYSMTGSTIEKKAFFLHGRSTNNGKSTIIAALLHIFGDYGATLQPNSLEAKTYASGGSGPSPDIASLEGKRFVSVPEPDRSMRLDAGLLKQLTGGQDSISARMLRENFHTFLPQFKLFLQCNDLPSTTDDALFSSGRVNVITFDRHFSEAEQDRTLETEFRKPENASGVLNWCLEGCRLYQCCGLQPPVSVQASTTAYRSESDLIGNFIDECLEAKAGTSTIAADVYTKYQYWCERFGYKKMSYKNFNRDMGRHVEFYHSMHGSAIRNFTIKNSDYYSEGCNSS
jgi:putative DNA primase/helicase